VRWFPDGDFWPLFCVLYFQRAACSRRTTTATARIPTARKITTDTVKVNSEFIRGQHSDDKHMDTITRSVMMTVSVVHAVSIELITAATDCIKCDSCLNMFHQECTGLSNDVFKVLISIISQSGWVCRQCRSELNRTHVMSVMFTSCKNLVNFGPLILRSLR